jgi:hypothetical protein
MTLQGLCLIAALCLLALAGAASWLLLAIAEHRRAQAASILQHCGLLERDDEE